METDSKKELQLYQSNCITRAAYKLTLIQKRIVNLAMLKSNSEGVAFISLDEFAEFYNITKNRALSDINAQKTNIVSAKVGIKHDNGSYEYHVWIQSFEYSSKKNTWRITFGNRVNKELSLLKTKFTMYSLLEVAKIKNIYTIRIYEHLAQFASIGSVNLDVEYLKNNFMLPESYKDFGLLRSKFLDPACKEISEKTNFSVRWEILEKKGRKITKLKFIFFDNSACYQ